MGRDRIDLTPLDPATDDARFERLVAAILARAEPELARRASGGVLALVGRWWGPALAAAAAIGAVALGSLFSGGRAAAVPVGLTDALDVPRPVGELLRSGREPTVEDLVFAMEEGLP